MYQVSHGVLMSLYHDVPHVNLFNLCYPHDNLCITCVITASVQLVWCKGPKIDGGPIGRDGENLG